MLWYSARNIHDSGRQFLAPFPEAPLLRWLREHTDCSLLIASMYGGTTTSKCQEPPAQAPNFECASMPTTAMHTVGIRALAGSERNVYFVQNVITAYTTLWIYASSFIRYLSFLINVYSLLLSAWAPNEEPSQPQIYPIRCSALPKAVCGNPGYSVTGKHKRIAHDQADTSL
ncbi:uncharacterized protein THITE_2130604 [Thermothielavioides terrestris NRRL 8126]|uniref:Uncharacterized protein n=1 Tax=Thermothielavioides terrestris (strain ATCC 38088 / NRRL 8126) TaxID=578455 RepID=G2RAN7_THETT|nr:uncharacterized protein THITE_2130604 [Thermothielavioides terrestris NRRL 8126]AEO68915.1 hypothetical protein THITE_2130604 [Thermothielavioides terrestris NRRL 8126]